MWLVSSTDRLESTHYAFAIEDYTSSVQIIFSLQKTSELWSFYKEMTLFGLWLFCYFWIKTFYFSVWLNNVLWNHFKWPIWNRFTLTLYNLTSVCIFSLLFSIHFLRCWRGEFNNQGLLRLVIVPFTLTTLTCDLGMIL